MSYDDARGGKQNLKYRLQLKENEKFTREIKLEKNMPSYVVNERKPARNGQPATTYVKKMIVDNHAFASGSHQLRFSVYVDSRLLSKNPPLKDRVRVVLRGITIIAEINPPIREHRRGENVLFQVYICKPDCVFLPHQGFSYSILLDQSAS